MRYIRWTKFWPMQYLAVKQIFFTFSQTLAFYGGKSHVAHALETNDKAHKDIISKK